jgi:hypothetical protein
MVKWHFYVQKTSQFLFIEGIGLMHTASGVSMSLIGKIAMSGLALALMT